MSSTTTSSTHSSASASSSSQHTTRSHHTTWSTTRAAPTPTFSTPPNQSQPLDVDGIYAFAGIILAFVLLCTCGCLHYRIRRLRGGTKEVYVSVPKPKLWEPQFFRSTGQGGWKDIMPISLHLAAPPQVQKTHRNRFRHLLNKTDVEDGRVEGDVQVQVVVVVNMPQKLGLEATASPEYHLGIHQSSMSGPVKH